MKKVIEIQNIKRNFQVGDETVHALRGVSFNINEGEFVTIMGTSGSGKSTLLNILGCLDTPTSGEYLLDDIPVRTMSKPQRAVLRNRKIGFVFQSYNLLPKTTAVENVELPLMYNSAVSASERRRRAIESLQAVGLGDRLEHKSNQVKEPVPPLEGNGNHSLFKLFLSDTGLLCTASMGGIQYDLLQGNLDVNKGAIMENVVAQELRAHGFDLYYFNTNRLGEVDFMVQSGRIVLSVEVKSGNDWTKRKALDNVLAVDDWALNKAYVLCKGNVRQDGRITYLPLYMSMFLEPERRPESMIFDLDFSALRQ